MVNFYRLICLLACLAIPCFSNATNAGFAEKLLCDFAPQQTYNAVCPTGVRAVGGSCAYRFDPNDRLCGAFHTWALAPPPGGRVAAWSPLPSCGANAAVIGLLCQCNPGYAQIGSVGNEQCVGTCQSGTKVSAQVAAGWFKSGTSSLAIYQATPKNICTRLGGNLCAAATSFTGAKLGPVVNGHRAVVVDVSGTLSGAVCAGPETPSIVTAPAPPCEGQSGTVNGLQVCLPPESEADKARRAADVAAQAASDASAAARSAAKAAGASDAVADAAARAAGSAAGSAASSTVMRGGTSASGAAAGAAAGKAAGAASAGLWDVGLPPPVPGAPPPPPPPLAGAKAGAGEAAASAARAAGGSPPAQEAAKQAANKAYGDAVEAGLPPPIAWEASKAAGDAAATQYDSSAPPTGGAPDTRIGDAAQAGDKAGKDAGSAKQAADKANDENKKPTPFCEENPLSPICKEIEDSEWSGACGSPAACKGDAIMCATAEQVRITACALTQTSGEADLYDAEKNKQGNQADELTDNSSVAMSSSMFDTSNPLSGSCISDKTIVVLGRSVVLPFSMVCDVLGMLGNLLVAVSMLLAGRIVVRG